MSAVPSRTSRWRARLYSHDRTPANIVVRTEPWMQDAVAFRTVNGAGQNLASLDLVGLVERAAGKAREKYFRFRRYRHRPERASSVAIGARRKLPRLPCRGPAEPTK